MDTSVIRNQRQANQYIGQNEGARIATHEMVIRMTAMQAQDYYGALWSIGLRTGSNEAQVIAMIEERKIVRTWPQRGTLHFVAAEDAGWMTALSAPRLLKGAKRRHEALGLDQATLVLAKQLFAQALEGGKVLTRPQMLELLEAAGISTNVGRGYHLLWYAAQTGLLYIGPMRAKQQTFGLLRNLPIEPIDLSREASIAELAKRYFISHGPATLQDFMWWSGLTSVEAKHGLSENVTLLRADTIEGRQYWQSKDIRQTSTGPNVLLLPGFDEYILGYKDRNAQLKPQYLSRIVPGGNGVFMPTVLENGRVVGSWKRFLKKDRVVVEVEYFERRTASNTELAMAADEYGCFVGLPVALQVS